MSAPPCHSISISPAREVYTLQEHATLLRKCIHADGADFMLNRLSVDSHLRMTPGISYRMLQATASNASNLNLWGCCALTTLFI